MKHKKYALILFTKYPEENKVKTRLIPSIGVIKATKLHKILTEMTLEVLKKFVSIVRDKKHVDIFIFFGGCDEYAMKEWLGKELYYVKQTGNDLGEKMNNAFKYVFKLNYSKAIIVGSDCPELDSEIINNAYKILDIYDAVFGKALDGGYYLVGLKELIPEIFMDIPWSTQYVLRRTLEICDKIDRTYYFTQTLSDIDNINDLEKFPQILKKL